jgi:hypothetical protein
MLAVMGPLLALLGIEADSISANLKRQAIIWGVIGAMGLIVLAFLLVALNSALTYAYGPVVAPLIIAVAAGVIAVAVFLVARYQDSIAAKRAAEKKKQAEMTALVTTAVITAIPLILKSPLFRAVGLPAGSAIASALLMRGRGGEEGHHHHK